MVGGKSDLSDSRRTVEREDAEKFKHDHNIQYLFETSSKSGFNTKKIFETLTREMINTRGYLK